MRLRFASAATLLVLACGSETGGPPEIAYGLEECDHCRMIISEEAHAAAVVGPQGSIRAFDDLGCLLAARESWRGDGARVWVHDVESAEWLDARRAVFVRQDAATTPMGSGLVALTTRRQAERRGATEDSIDDWGELVSHGAALGRDENNHRDYEEESSR